MTSGSDESGSEERREGAAATAMRSDGDEERRRNGDVVEKRWPDTRRSGDAGKQRPWQRERPLEIDDGASTQYELHANVLFWGYEFLPQPECLLVATFS